MSLKGATFEIRVNKRFSLTYLNKIIAFFTYTYLCCRMKHCFNVIDLLRGGNMRYSIFTVSLQYA